MALLLVSAVERSVTYPMAPTAQGAEGAFRRARLGPRVADGDWIGSGARVTRTAVIGERFATRVAWVYGWPAGGPWDPRAALGELAAILRARVASELEALGGSWEVATAPWAEAVNGPLSWWASGAAAVTQTRDEFPVGTGRLDATENALGPTTGATHPTSPGEAGRGGASVVGEVMPWLLGAGAVAAGGWLWWQWRAARAVIPGEGA